MTLDYTDYAMGWDQPEVQAAIRIPLSEEYRRAAIDDMLLGSMIGLPVCALIDHVNQRSPAKGLIMLVLVFGALHLYSRHELNKAREERQKGKQQ